MEEGDSRDTMERRPAQGAIRPGIVKRDEVLLTDRHLTLHVGGSGVFATPAMIWLMEDTAHNSVAPYLGLDQTTVGYEVHVYHRAPAALGDRIVVQSRLASVDKNRLTFEVRATRGEVVLGDGIHRRAVVSARA